jgi:hypothetical protein
MKSYIDGVFVTTNVTTDIRSMVMFVKSDESLQRVPLGIAVEYKYVCTVCVRVHKLEH